MRFFATLRYSYSMEHQLSILLPVLPESFCQKPEFDCRFRLSLSKLIQLNQSNCGLSAAVVLPNCVLFFYLFGPNGLFPCHARAGRPPELSIRFYVLSSPIIRTFEEF